MFPERILFILSKIVWWIMVAKNKILWDFWKADLWYKVQFENSLDNSKFGMKKFSTFILQKQKKNIFS